MASIQGELIEFAFHS